MSLSGLYAGCMAACGTSTLLVPFLSHPAALGTVASVFGLTIAANYSLTTPILVELVSIHHFCNAYGLLFFVQGIANLVGPPFAGWLYDASRQWYWTFGTGGASIILSGLLLLIIPSAKRINRLLASHSSPTNNVANETG